MLFRKFWFYRTKKSGNLEKIANVDILDYDDNKISTDFIKTKWETELTLKTGKKVTLDEFEILTTMNERGEKVYFLKVSSSDSSISTGSFLIKDSSNTYLMRGKTCTCEGCASGCSLVVSGNICYCSGGCPSNPDGTQNCKKTETVVIGGGDGSSGTPIE